MKVLKVLPATLDAMIKAWSKSHQVYSPSLKKSATASADCAPGWSRVESSAQAPQLSLLAKTATGPTPASVKTFFFPQPEVLLTYTVAPNHPDQGLMRPPEKVQPLQVVIGVRPCDARSVLLNNLPYQEDAFFQANRERTVLIGTTCTQTLSTCFCTQMGGSPLGHDGLDLAISQAGEGKDGDDSFLVEVCTPQGEALLAELTDFELIPASDQDLSALAARRDEAGKGIASGIDSLSALKAKELGALYEAPMWKALGESCINCGACTFICPTCYCFDIQDEVVRGQGRRIRYWDSCMFPLYSLHTTGHNPRGQKVQRTRNRFLHKLKYFPDRFGPFSCVGCGRCVQDCPVNIDIREVLSDLTQLAGVE